MVLSGASRLKARQARTYARLRAIALDAIAIAAAAAGLGLVAAAALGAKPMLIIWPVLVSLAVFAAFVRILAPRARGGLFGEVGFVYVAFALAYTVLPALKFLALDFDIPQSFDAVLFAASYPTPEELGLHFWRHAVFIFGVSAGFLVVRLLPTAARPRGDAPRLPSGLAIAGLSIVVACSLALDLELSRAATEYVEYYTRFEHLGWLTTKLIGATGVLKSGAYFVILVLLFNRYRRYRCVIPVLAAFVCAYEMWRSLGSRIEAFTILLAVFALYQLQVRRIGAKQGAVLLLAVALMFSAIGFVRTAGYSVERALASASEQRTIQGSEFDAVFASGFHVYKERNQGTLPPRDWRMFFWEFIAAAPFVDHTTYHPQYWYARNYFPQAPVPPATLGVIAESGLWGGEADLLLRSLLNGALFAGLTRWFLRRRQRWWALTVYVYCFATCVLTLKYSVLYQIIPLVRVVLPTLLLTAVLLNAQARLARSSAAAPIRRRRSRGPRRRAERARDTALVAATATDGRMAPEPTSGAGG